MEVKKIERVYPYVGEVHYLLDNGYTYCGDETKKYKDHWVETNKSVTCEPCLNSKKEIKGGVQKGDCNERVWFTPEQRLIMIQGYNILKGLEKDERSVEEIENSIGILEKGMSNRYSKLYKAHLNKDIPSKGREDDLKKDQYARDLMIEILDVYTKIHKKVVEYGYFSEKYPPMLLTITEIDVGGGLEGEEYLLNMRVCNQLEYLRSIGNPNIKEFDRQIEKNEVITGFWRNSVYDYIDVVERHNEVVGKRREEDSDIGYKNIEYTEEEIKYIITGE